jgi:prolyl oligopeptidase
MSLLTDRPPHTVLEPVTDVLHGVPITDPYRWLEDQNSPQTRAWIDDQTRYARGCLDALRGRERIRARVQELLDVEVVDSFLKNGRRYFFRKRLRGQEQPSICFREGPGGQDVLLVDPSARGTGSYTAVKPLRVSHAGSLLLYEVKQGGERTGRFEILDVANRTRLPDSLPHGYLRGFAFSPDEKSFYYSHEATGAKHSSHRAVWHHILGTSPDRDRQVFSAGDDERLRVAIVSGRRALGILVYRFLDKAYLDFYLYGIGSTGPAVPIIRNAEYRFAPHFLEGRIIACTDRDAPNRRIVEVQPRKKPDPLFLDLVAESDAVISGWHITANRILVSRTRATLTHTDIFDSYGKALGTIAGKPGETLRVIATDSKDDDVFFERESFTQPAEIEHLPAGSATSVSWLCERIPFDSSAYAHIDAEFPSKDGAKIPISLVGKPEVLDGRMHPLVMTSYGGYGVPMTPQFSVLVAFLIERGCLFALPNIRGGSEFGAAWHDAAKRRNRQVAFDDFLSAADWLVRTGRTTPRQLAVFGGSNSGLLVAASMTQRPELFRAVLCMVPLSDMLRYHLFDNAHVWKDEFGTAESPDDFRVLASYSPYHAVREGVPYPATLLVSGDADQNCNPMHARKMTARLQAANSSHNSILLDYSSDRGHSPVLPLSTRIKALTDRLAFLCDQLALDA